MKCQATECFCTDFNRRFCKNYRNDKKPKKKSTLQTKRKPTGEMDLFKKLWEERPHVCFVSGDTIRFSPSVFFHILGKGAFEKYRLNPNNIIFVKPEYHDDWHNMTRAELLQKDCDWQKVFDMYDELKRSYIQQLREELIVYLPKKK